MKNKKGFTLVEVITAAALLTVAGAFMLNAVIVAAKTSVRNQMLNEVSLIGVSARNYIKEELIYATEVIAFSSAPPDDSEVYSFSNQDGVHCISNTGSGGKWLYRKLDASTVPLFGGQEASPGAVITLSMDDPDMDIDNVNKTIKLKLEVKKNGAVFMDEFMIKNINGADISGAVTSGSLYINYK